MHERALIEAKKVIGGNTALAKALSEHPEGEQITPQAISQWKVVPDVRVLQVEELTGVSRHRLRSDIFGMGEVAA